MPRLFGPSPFAFSIGPLIALLGGGGGGSTYTPPEPSYSGPGGQGYRVVDIGVTSSPAFAAGTASNLVDGGTGANSTDAAYFTSGRSDYVITFDFGPLSRKRITEITWRQSTTSNHGTWVIEGDNGSDIWTMVKSAFTLGGSTVQVIDMADNIAAYRLYRFRQTGGTTSHLPWLQEVEFKISEHEERATLSTNFGGRGDRSALGISVTTDATVSSGSISNVLDGSTANNSTGSFYFSSGQSGRTITIDFGRDIYFDKFVWRQSSTNSQGTWEWHRSSNGTDFTAVTGSELTINAQDNRVTFTPPAAYRYWRLVQTSGTTSSGPWVQEFEFATRDDSV